MILYGASVSSSTSTLTSSDVGGCRACLLIQYTSLPAPPSLLAILPSSLLPSRHPYVPVWCRHLMPPSRRRRRSFPAIQTITSAPPSRLLPCYNSKTHSPPSAMAFSTAFGLWAHSFPPLQPSGFIPLLLLLVHNLTIDLDSSSPIPCL